MLYGALVVTLWTCYGALQVVVLLLLLLLVSGLDASSARLPTACLLFHAHTTHLVTGVMLLSGTASQQTYVMRTSATLVSGVNLKLTGFLATGAECDILFNCAIQIAELN